VAVAFCALLAAVLSGCATSVPKWTETPLPPAAADASAAPAPESQVILQAYDTIRIKFLYWPELDDEQMIRPDGKISLLMVGEVEAQNRTPEALQKELIALYEPKLNEPEINVVVTSLANNRVYIGGEVATPGLILIQGRLTVLGAVMQAGGFIESSAKKNSVVIVRQQGGKQYARTVDLKDALSGTETEPFYLQPYDIVYVPRTTIVHVNEFVAQYIDGVIPKHVTASVGLYNFQQSSYPSAKTPISLTLPGGSK
jgi:polysaccharide export outer membrane protein